MTTLRRAFLAAVPPAPVLDAIGELVAGANRRGFRWTRREQWHITIQYFGKVGEADALVAALEDATAGRPSVPVQLMGAGGFPSERRAAVYWVGVENGEALGELHDAVMAQAGGFVRARDRIPYRPHLTLARLASPKSVKPEAEALAGHRLGPSFTVGEVVLYESETGRDGAVHREIARFPLG